MNDNIWIISEFLDSEKTDIKCNIYLTLAD